MNEQKSRDTQDSNGSDTGYEEVQMDTEQSLKHVSGKLARVSELLAMSPEDRDAYDEAARESAKQAYYTKEGQSRLGNTDPSMQVEPSEADIDFIAETIERHLEHLQLELRMIQAELLNK